VKKSDDRRLETLPPNAKIADLLGVFDRGRSLFVMDDDKFSRADYTHRFAFVFAASHAKIGGAAPNASLCDATHASRLRVIFQREPGGMRYYIP